MNVTALTLRSKLIAAFFSMALLTVGLGAFAVVQLGKVNANMEDIASNALPSVEVAGKLRLTANRLRRVEADHLLSTSDADKTKLENRLSELRRDLADQQRAYEPLVSEGDEHAAYEQYKSHRDAYLTAVDAMVALSRAGEQGFGVAKAHFRERSGAAFEVLANDLSRLIDINVKAGDESHRAAQQTYAAAWRWTLAFVGLAVVAAFALGLAITRSVARQLGGEPAEAAQLARSVAEGDLRADVRVATGDPGSMMAQLRSMQEGLARMVAGVRQNADSVAAASAQIALGNMDLSSRTEEQASALEQTAASMEQLGSTVGQNADNARQANQLALGASSVAERGGAVVGEVVQTMKGITESSRRISDIIGVIDGIAFQTNILALNAAVEAARAGEQGRGFAVVATEVRNLAQRSAGAAREIKDLITTSVERVEQGTALVDRAGETMDEVVRSIKRVADIMGEITAASAEQSAGVSQVGEAVAQMDRNTQQNAALVEESAAAAESLKCQAQKLVDTVAAFKLA